MAVQGPDYCKDTADKAVSEILMYLKDRYGIHRYPLDQSVFGENMADERAKDITLINEAIHNLFLHKSWEDW